MKEGLFQPLISTLLLLLYVHYDTLPSPLYSLYTVRTNENVWRYVNTECRSASDLNSERGSGQSESPK
jgi:hypothetical protein